MLIYGPRKVESPKIRKARLFVDLGSQVSARTSYGMTGDSRVVTRSVGNRVMLVGDGFQNVLDSLVLLEYPFGEQWVFRGVVANDEGSHDCAKSMRRASWIVDDCRSIEDRSRRDFEGMAAIVPNPMKTHRHPKKGIPPYVRLKVTLRD